MSKFKVSYKYKILLYFLVVLIATGTLFSYILVKREQQLKLDRITYQMHPYTDLIYSHITHVIRKFPDDIHNEKLRRGEGAIRFTKIEITNALGESCPSFKIGESIFFKMSYKVFKIMDGVKIHIALKSGISRETVTNFEHILLDNPVLPDTEGDVTLEIAAHHVIRSGEYPLYFHLADKHDSPASIDVVDEVTLPLVISEESDLHTPGIPMRSGCFSVPSRIIESKIHSPNHHA